MSNNYSLGKYLRFLFFLTIWFGTGSDSSAQAQSLACDGGLNISVESMCMAVIDARDLLKGESINLNPNDYTLIVKNKNGTTPLGIQFKNTNLGLFQNGNQGSYIKFSGPGFYIISVRRNSDNITCWSEVLVEDKLPPVAQRCPCPDTAAVIDAKCIFSCAMVNRVYGNDSITGLVSANPLLVDNCGNLGDVEFTDELKQDTGCGNWVIIRTWRTLVSDGHNGFIYKDLKCRQKFLFKPVDFSKIHPPKNKITLECGTSTHPDSLRKFFSNKVLFPNTHPDSVIRCLYPHIIEFIPGIGTLTHIIGEGLSPGTNDDLCKLTASYTETEKIFTCKHSYKFVRSWHVIDWCTNRTLPPMNQIIKVQDTIAPFFYIKDTIPAVSTDPWYCLKDLKVPPPDSIKDNCASLSDIVWKAFVDTPSGKITADESNGYTLKGLERGMYNVSYMVTDPCGNTRVRKSKLIVKDDVGPIALSKYQIIVTFSESNGECFAKVYPESIDAGSFDACDGKMLIKKIRRYTDTIPHGDFVKFHETDITTINAAGVAYGEVSVELKVTDKSGNSSLAWTKVRIEDKNSRTNIACGDTLIRLDCSAILDTAIIKARPKVIFHACKDRPLNVTHTIRSSNINPSCNTGVAIVDYRISGSTDVICTKRFILGDTDSLYIIWPPEELVVTCVSTDFGQPTFINTNCNLIAKTVEKNIFDVQPSEGFCRKIVFRHTVIDWCKYQANHGDTIGLYRFNQIIKVKDNTKPTVTCVDKSVSAGSVCRLSGVQVSAVGKDEGICGTPLLRWEVQIDTNSNGTYDINLTPLVGDSGKVTAIINYPLKVGSYFVRWKAKDDCGNSGESICKISIVDTKAPVAQCISTISTTVMNTNGAVSIWAKDFDPDGKSIDECGNALFYSFSSTSPNVPSMAFRCEDIPNGITVTKELAVYVYDKAGNKDVCWVKLRIDDTSNVCPDSVHASTLVSGIIMTPSGQHLQSAQVFIENKNVNSMSSEQTNVAGEYVFNNIAPSQGYEIKAQKSDDLLNGISTLDLILIQRHILGIQHFDSAYKTIAADANADKRVSALDIVELRRLLLGHTSALAHGQSWKFLNANQKFSDIRNPWPLQENWNLDITEVDLKDQNFIAIKLGDVNGSAIANSLVSGARSNEYVYLKSDDKKVKKGEYVHVIFTVKQKQLYGLQMSLDLSGGQWIDLSSDRLKLSESNWLVSEGQMDISWNIMEPTNEEVDFQLSFEATRDGWLSDILSINEHGVKSELYHGIEIESKHLDLQFNRSPLEHSTIFELHQNIPNPFNGETVIPFYISQEGRVDLSVFDMTGRSIYSQKQNFKAGKNTILLNRDQLKSTGVMYYQLNFKEQVATRKMIMMD